MMGSPASGDKMVQVLNVMVVADTCFFSGEVNIGVSYVTIHVYS
jgi:hypothetical protein